jgi:hypothetical protein
MLRRVILALLIACLAFPAAAMPMLHARMVHTPEAQAAMEMTMHHRMMPGSHHDNDMAKHMAGGMAGPAHECIGCMARYDGVALPAAPMLPAALVLCIVAPAQIAGAGPGPEIPPPRC